MVNINKLYLLYNVKETSYFNLYKSYSLARDDGVRVLSVFEDIRVTEENPR